MDKDLSSAQGPKNLVVFCDGTNDEFGVNNTNVIRLLSAAVHRSERQVVFYDPGVGTFPAPGALTPAAKRVTKLLGSAIGYGLTQNVGVCYDFLMQHYRTGDRIYLFGFSRGAYTARVLAALLHVCGLLRTNNPNLATYAMNLFRAEAVRAKKRNDKAESKSGTYQPLLLPLCEKFRSVFSSAPPVHFLGLWDTVSSVGSIYNPFKLPYTRWNPSVQTVRHAVSIDERRKFFRSNLWSSSKQVTDVRQVWFAGVHGDIGGGYPESESGLAKIALAWMMAEAEQYDLLIDPQRIALVLPSSGAAPGPVTAPDPLAPMHDEVDKPGWKLAQWVPRRVWRREPGNGRFKPHWSLSPKQKPRFIPNGAMVHSSVFQRIAGDPHYRPRNLPESMVDETGTPRVRPASVTAS
jgi:uncharacterized protein (DUF2235 family)